VHSIGDPHTRGEDAEAVTVEDPGELFQVERDTLLIAERPGCAVLEETHGLGPAVGGRREMAEDLVNRESQRLAGTERTIGDEHDLLTGRSTSREARLDPNLHVEARMASDPPDELRERGLAEERGRGKNARLGLSVGLRQDVARHRTDADHRLADRHLVLTVSEPSRGERPHAARITERLEHAQVELELVEPIDVETPSRHAGGELARGIEEPERVDVDLARRHLETRRGDVPP